MATEDIKIEGGHLKVERFGTKQNVDVALSDVDSVTYVRSGDPTADGSLILHLKNGYNTDPSGESAAVIVKDVVIRVANDDAGDVLALLNTPKTPAKEEKATATAAKRTTSE